MINLTWKFNVPKEIKSLESSHKILNKAWKLEPFSVYLQLVLKERRKYRVSLPPKFICLKRTESDLKAFGCQSCMPFKGFLWSLRGKSRVLWRWACLALVKLEAFLILLLRLRDSSVLNSLL